MTLFLLGLFHWLQLKLQCRIQVVKAVKPGLILDLKGKVSSLGMMQAVFSSFHQNEVVYFPS